MCVTCKTDPGHASHSESDNSTAICILFTFESPFYMRWYSKYPSLQSIIARNYCWPILLTNEIVLNLHRPNTRFASFNWLSFIIVFESKWYFQIAPTRNQLPKLQVRIEERFIRFFFQPHWNLFILFMFIVLCELLYLDHTIQRNDEHRIKMSIVEDVTRWDPLNSRFLFLSWSENHMFRK